MRNSRPAPALALKCRRDARVDTLETCSAICRARSFSSLNECPVARAALMSGALEGVNLPIMVPLHEPNVGARRRVAPSGFEAPARGATVR